MQDGCHFRIATREPGASWAGLWRDSLGQPMIIDAFGTPVAGTVTIDKELQELQADPHHAPVPHVQLLVDLQGRNPYRISMPVDDLNGKRADFVAAMEAKVLPKGMRCTEALLDGMLAASFAPETWKVHSRSLVAVEGGLYANGVCLADKQFTIVAETTNAYGELFYTLRCADGSRVSVPASNMHLGKYGYAINATIYDGVGLWLHLSAEWKARTEAEKRDFDLEPLRTKQDAIRAQIERRGRAR